MNDSTRMDEPNPATPATPEQAPNSALQESPDNSGNNGSLTPAPERTLSPREEAMQALVSKQREHAGITDTDMPDDVSPAAQPGQVAEPTAGQGGSLPSLQEGLPVYQNSNGDYVMRLKVDGVEQEMSLNNVQATMQKHQAADARLRQAAEMRHQLEAERHQFQQQVAAQHQPPTQHEPAAYREQLPSHSSTEEGATDDVMEQAQAIIDSLYDGDPEDAAKALAAAMAKPSTATVTPEQIRQEALSAVQQQEYDRNLKDGFARFQNEYSDIMADPDLQEMADRKSLEIQQLHPDWTPEAILMESGRVVREKFQPAAPAEEQPSSSNNPQPTNQRQARKQNLQAMPHRQNTAYTPPQQPQPSNAPADVIANMKRGRGQQ